ncbi:MAG TPA: SusC/RagA family TonB-linked outer membrane protein [Gemmatimonadaceae bacterium]
MHNIRRFGRYIAASLVIIASFAGATRAQGQASLTGRVTDANGNPVPGANVVIPSLGVGIGAATSAEGTYTINLGTNAGPGQNLVVIARRIGFAPVTHNVTIRGGAQTENFVLSQEARQLDQVIISGVSEATSARNLTISVGKVGDQQLKDVPPTNAVSALAGKISGVRVAQTQGTPGSVPAIRVRTSAVLGVGGNQPLFIVDGVLTQGGLADLNANDIESIEVVKGAASATAYGSTGANGVVNITTKRGRDGADGKLNFLTRNEFGSSKVEHFVPLNQHHPYELNADGSFKLSSAGQRIIKADRYADAAYPAGTYRNQLQENLQSGRTVTNYGQLSVRRGNTNFATSFSRDTDRGILPLLDGFKRQNLRLNVDQGIGSKADLSMSMLYGLSTSDMSPNTTGTSTFFALLQAPPDVDLVFPNGPGTTQYSPVLPAAATGGTARGNPLYDLAHRSYNDRRERIFGSIVGRWRPFSWINFDGSYGTDRLNERTTNFYDRGLLNTGNTDVETPGVGSLVLQNTANTSANSQIGANLKFDLGRLHSTTRVAYLYEDERDNFNQTGFSKLLVASVPDLQAADPTQLATGNTTSNIENIRTMNGIVTQNLNFDDRYLVQLLGRRDGSSLFGSDNRWNNFYQVSGAWRVTQDFKIPGFQELKIRAARGTAGLRPGFEYQYETFNVAAGQLTKATIGNKLLKPAIQTENEVGVNASLFNRFDVEFVKSDRHTKGAFLLVPLSLAQSGGFTAQWQNAARIGGRTFELSLNTRVIEKPNFSYNFTLTGERSRQKIDELGRAPFRVGSASQNQAIFFYKAGETMGVIYGQRWITDPQQLKDNPLNANINLDNYTINSDGLVVLKSCLGTACERPIAYVNPQGVNNVKIGDVNPDYTWGLANTFRLGGFTVYGLFDGTHGGDIYNFTKNWMFQDMRHASLDQAGKPADQKHTIDYYTVGLYNGLEPSSYFVEDGSYVKFREFSVSYNFAQNFVRRLPFMRSGQSLKLAFIGRNLKTWTNYSGFDPEASSNGDFNFRIDGFRYPSFRTFTGQLEIGF